MLLGLPNMLRRREPRAHVEAIYERVDDDIDLLQTRVAERLDVPRSAVAEVTRGLVELSLAHLDGRTVSLTPTGTEQGTPAIHRHRLAERFLTDVLDVKSGDPHRVAEPCEHVAPANVETTLDRYLTHPTTCPHANPTARSGYVEQAMIALSEAPVGERVHVERIAEQIEGTAGLLERNGLVRGLTVSVIDRRQDNATLVRTGRGDIWVDADVCSHLLVTLGDIDRITDELRRRGVASSAHTTPNGRPMGDAR